MEREIFQKKKDLSVRKAKIDHFKSEYMFPHCFNYHKHIFPEQLVNIMGFPTRIQLHNCKQQSQGWGGVGTKLEENPQFIVKQMQFFFLSLPCTSLPYSKTWKINNSSFNTIDRSLSAM